MRVHLVAGHAIPCDAWVYRSTSDGRVYSILGAEDMPYVIGRTTVTFRAGDSVTEHELRDINEARLREVARMMGEEEPA